MAGVLRDGVNVTRRRAESLSPGARAAVRAVGGVAAIRQPTAPEIAADDASALTVAEIRDGLSSGRLDAATVLRQEMGGKRRQTVLQMARRR